MKRRILFLFFFLVMVGVTSPAYPEQIKAPGIKVAPLCGTHLEITDSRKNCADITEIIIGDTKVEPTPTYQTDIDDKTYKFKLPDNIKERDRLTLKSNTHIIYDNIVSTVPFIQGPTIALPLIISAEPKMVIAGNVLTIIGKDFGNNPDNITMYILNNTPIKASWISLPDKNGSQQIQFVMPTSKDKTNLYSTFNYFNLDALLYHEIDSPEGTLKSNWIATGISNENTYFILILISLILISIILSTVYIVLRRMARDRKDTGPVSFLDICSVLLSDKKTNTLSLSKLQAFLWTIVIFWSYLYLSLGKMLIMCDFSIPQLDTSLIQLLGISYGGLIAARGLGNSRPKNDLVTTEQKISDFFSENNEISLPRLQLFIFTFVGIAIYIFNLFNPELFDKGLPEIPGTLNGLFLVSQGGYLGGKLTGSTVVNYLLPHRIKSGSTTDIMLVGQGFMDHTKLLLQGTQSPIETSFFNQNTLGFKLSTQSLGIGLKQLVFIPPSGTSFVVDNALEIINVAIRKTITVGVGGTDALEVDFTGIVLSGEPLAAHLLPPTPSPTPPGGTPPSAVPQGDTPLSITHVAGNRYRVTRPGGLITGDTIRIAAHDGSFAFETTVNGTATEGYEPVTLL